MGLYLHLIVPCHVGSSLNVHFSVMNEIRFNCSTVQSQLLMSFNRIGWLIRIRMLKTMDCTFGSLDVFLLHKCPLFWLQLLLVQILNICFTCSCNIFWYAGHCSQGAVKIMAKDLIRTRHQITKFYALKSQLQGVSLRIQVTIRMLGFETINQVNYVYITTLWWDQSRETQMSWSFLVSWKFLLLRLMKNPVW